jgi:tetratricopeptide (TPR) repeat protein/predicted Ser/Thr protein kinase
MTPEQWARVKELFHAALEQEEGRRRAYVAEASAGDALVRAEVERLLDADHQSVEFIEYPAVDALLSGQVVGHYEIGRLLGAGGMGRVYAARDLELGRDVALKIATVESEEAQARLRREAQHASRLSHPHICHIYDVGRAGGRVFVVMELVSGRSLADVVREGPLPPAAARRYGLEIADALAHAHEHGVMHRDLKSTNVMITPKRGAKVLDFGLARMLDTHRLDVLSQSQRSVTAEGMMAGTLSYMPPELLRGERGDQRADIWTLGILLYEMVSGRRPFTGATGFELSAAILHQPPPPLPAAVPAPMRAIVQRCLEKNPGDRFQQAADVHLALEEMKAAGVAGRRIPAAPMRLIAALVLAVVTVTIAAVWFGNRSGRFDNARGYGLLEAGQFDQAIAAFQSVADDQPDDANAWDSLGEGFLASGMADEALDAYSRALALDGTFEPSILGRSLALAGLGRYEEALDRSLPDFRVQAYLLSRVGRYREAAEVLDQGGRRSVEDGDNELAASALLTSSWLLLEQNQHGRALEAVRAAEMALAEEPDHSFLVLADLLGGIAEIRSGRLQNAIARHTAQRSRYDSDERVQANWVAALEGEIALAQGEHDRATASFNAARTPVWLTLGDDAFAVFVTNSPSRDGRARVELSRGNTAAAIEEYRRLTTRVPGRQPSAVLEPRHVLALARLLDQQNDAVEAMTQYARFVTLWARADQDLPELAEAHRALARLSGS